jgi:hypothetical protein
MVRKLIVDLNGRPGDGALEVFAQLKADISNSKQVLDHLRADLPSDDAMLYRILFIIHWNLCSLQLLVDKVPPAILKENINILKQRYGASA